MRPQDTVIFLLGELKGQVGGLKGSVDAANASQATINTANEAEHAKFRAEIANHTTLIAGFTQDRAEARSGKLTGLQRTGIWVAGVCGGIGAIAGTISAIAFITHP